MKMKAKGRHKSYAYLPYTVELRVLTIDPLPDKVLGLVCLDKDGKVECTIVGDKQFFQELGETLRENADVLDDFNGRPA